MPNFVPISRERHADKGWKRFDSYAFAARTALVPLVGAELPKAAMSLPIAFVQQDERYIPVAVLGIEPTSNLFVAPDGRWLGAYIPSALRGHPFMLARTEGENRVLCMDEDSGLLTEAGQGEPFFADSGEPAEGLKQVLDFLQQVERNREQTALVCDALARLDLIQPWPIQLKTGEKERQIEGLSRIDEAALNQLSDEHFLELRRAGALPMAYCQLLAMQHITLLGRLVDLRANTSRTTSKASAPFSLEDQDVLKFDWDSR
ncbi:SapC family protein [Allochromatium palmeri]|uniref:Peptidase n=1 Tax=Allochromatium palmeri TaxID=231048 RepID=A0A6N8E9R5_9GAMM|nr:SapC family protein [Allochromatium palmeri]MTW20210.1 peptidase [Allochromatium palmeri]